MITAELLERESCALCRTSHLKILIPTEALPDSVNVLQCIDCGLVFLESRAPEDALDPEEAAYWDSDEQKKIYFKDDVLKTFLKEFEGRLKTLERYVPTRGRLLDVGCGVGHFLYVARKRGWLVDGLDISPQASRAAKDAYGLGVSVGTLDESPFARSTFNAITLWDVIEHIRRPVENVKAMNRLLRMGGVVVMKTPNESGLFKQLALFLYRCFGRRASFLLKYVYYVPHYFSYSPSTMAALLTQGGFEVVALELDETPQEFATAKIHEHYKVDPKRALVIRLLPLMQWVARLVRRQNKLVVYAKKVREA